MKLDDVERILAGDTDVSRVYLGDRILKEFNKVPVDPAQVYIDDVLLDSPVGFWPMQDLSGGLSDIAGTHDAVEKAAGVTLSYSNPGPVSGISSVGLASNGVAGGWTVPHHEDFSSREFTAEIWVHVDAPGPNNLVTGTLFEKGPTVGTEYAITLLNLGRQFEARVGNTALSGQYLEVTPWTSILGEWMHVAMVCDGDTGPLRLYINGIQVASDSSTNGTRASNTSGATLGIGWSQRHAFSLNAKFSMMAFYDYALSQSRIQSHFDSMMSLTNQDAASAYQEEVILDSPIAFWPMQETHVVSVMSDVIAGRHATSVGSEQVSAMSGPVDGVRSAFTPGRVFQTGWAVADDDVFTPTGAFTVEAWVMPTPGSISSEFGAFFEKNAGSSVEYGLVAMPTAQRVEARVGTNGANGFYLTDNTAPLTNEQWNHVVMVCESATGPLNVYINGVLKATDTTTSGTRFTGTTGTLKIGYTDRSGIPFRGKLSMLAFYGHALSSDRVAAHYDAMMGT